MYVHTDDNQREIINLILTSKNQTIMSLILLIIIAVVVIVIIKKNRKAKEESAPVVMNENANQINFFTESKEDMAEQKSQCQAFINYNEENRKFGAAFCLFCERLFASLIYDINTLLNILLIFSFFILLLLIYHVLIIT